MLIELDSENDVWLTAGDIGPGTGGNVWVQRLVCPRNTFHLSFAESEIVNIMLDSYEM